MIGLTHYLVLSLVLFCIGLTGIFLRKNILILFLCLELMLTSVILCLAAFTATLPKLHGHAAIVFIITAAAAEIAIGLTLTLVLYRQKDCVSTTALETMKG